MNEINSEIAFSFMDYFHFTYYFFGTLDSYCKSQSCADQPVPFICL